MKWLKRITLALLTPLLLLAAAEAIVQVIGDPRAKDLVAEAKEQPSYWKLAGAGILDGGDAATRFVLRPGFEAAIGGIDYRINSLGLRGSERALAKTPGRKRILVVGDSYAFGLGVKEEGTLDAAIERDASAVGTAIEAINFGVPAYNTAQELALLETLGFTLAPDLVVLLYYPNDNVEATLRYSPRFRAPYVDELPLPDAWKPALSASYLYSLAAKFDSARRADAGEFDTRGTHNWPVTTARLRAFAATCTEHHVPFLFAPLPELSDHFQLNDDASEVAVDHARVLAFARDEKWPVVDLRAAFRAKVKAIEKLFVSLQPLDNHLTAEGYAIVADALAPEVARLLAGK